MLIDSQDTSDYCMLILCITVKLIKASSDETDREEKEPLHNHTKKNSYQRSKWRCLPNSEMNN